LGIEREMACVEYVDLRARCVLVISFWFAKIEGDIVLALEDQALWLRLLHAYLPLWIGLDTTTYLIYG
jgi:hypothetical protein